MRAYFFPALFFCLLGLILAAPYTGVLIWAWISMMNPHQIVGGWLSTFPVNTIAVAVLVLALFLHGESAFPPLNPLLLTLLAFLFWCIITTMTALSPAVSAARADLSIKNMIFGLAIAATTTNRVRFQALLWVFVLSYGFFGVKGGGFTLLTGGAGNVIGPPNTGTEDRNVLALVMLMMIPLANYLRLTSANRLVRIGLLGLMLLTAVAVLGTFSRGGLIGLTFLGLYFWWTNPNKLTVAVSVLAIGLASWSVLPERWFERMSTVERAEMDESFQGRVDAWHFAFNAASSRLTGVGFSGTEDRDVFQRYMPMATATIDRGRAAHSIYFQVLGDHGFIGLGLYVAILALAWGMAGRLARAANGDNAWLAPFGKMARVALATYFVAGAALSMAYDASIYCLLGLLTASARLVREPVAAVAGIRASVKPRSRLG